VRIACRRDGNRQLIVEMTLGLKGAIAKNPDIGTLALAAQKTDPGCPGGIVDRAGLQ